MIKFGSNDKVENIGILEKEEVEAYLNFLAHERERHETEIVVADIEIEDIKSFACTSLQFDEALIEFWNSATRRHKKDIEGIDVLVTTLKGFYGI